MSWFYDKEIQVYIYADCEDEHGISRTGYKLLESEAPIMVDVQPYSTEKAKKDYGYNIETTKRLFCDIIPEITEDSLIKYKEQYFSIQKIIPWDDYLDVMLLEKNNVIVVENGDP